MLQLCILLQDFQDLFPREFHGDKAVIERQKGEDLLQGNSPFGDIVPYSATVDEGYISACLLPHGVTYKISYVGFALVVPYERNGSLTDNPAVFLLYPAVVSLDDPCQLRIILSILAGHNLFKLSLFRMPDDPAGGGIDLEFQDTQI